MLPFSMQPSRPNQPHPRKAATSPRLLYTCHYCPSVSLDADLGAALERLPRGIHTPSASPESTRVRHPGGPRVKVGTAAEGATVKEGSYLVLPEVIGGELGAAGGCGRNGGNVLTSLRSGLP